MPLVYREPTVMWRMCRGDGLSSHAIIRLHRDGPLVIWFLNNKPVGCRGFKDVTSALNFTDRMQAQNWTAGWRLVD